MNRGLSWGTDMPSNVLRCVVTIEYDSIAGDPLDSCRYPDFSRRTNISVFDYFDTRAATRGSVWLMDWLSKCCRIFRRLLLIRVMVAFSDTDN